MMVYLPAFTESSTLTTDQETIARFAVTTETHTKAMLVYKSEKRAYRISGKFRVIKGSREKISRSKIFAVWAFHENLTRGENIEEYVWKRLVHSWLPCLSRNLGAATGAVALR